MSRLTRDGTAKPVSRDQILRRNEQDWQPHPIGPSLAICDDHTYITCIMLYTVHAIIQ